MNEVKVSFNKIAEAKFKTITPDSGTFYRVVTESGQQDFYLGNQKLNNAADIVSAINALSADGGVIKNINDVLTIIQGDENTTDSIKNQIKIAVDSINNIIGDVPEDSTIMEEIEKAQEAATYDDTDIKASVQANKEALNILNGDATREGSVKKQVADAIASIIAEAPDSFDTLKEISDWISSHADSASDMNSQIIINKNSIADINALIGTELPEGISSTTVIDYIAEAVISAVNSLTSSISATNGSVLTGITIEKGKLVAKTDKVLANVATSGKASDVVYQTADGSNPIVTVAQVIDNILAALGEGSVADQIKTAIELLDSTVAASNNAVLTGITIVDDKITEKTEKVLGTASEKNIEDFDATGSADAVLGNENDTANKNTVYGVKAAIKEVADNLVWNEIE